MIALKRDLTSDPLNLAWDAAIAESWVAGDAPEDDDIEILRRFHALDTAPAPDERFIEQLAQQMEGIKQTRVRMRPDSELPTGSTAISIASLSLSGRSFQRRKFPMQAVAALLAIVLIGSLAIGQWARTANESSPPFTIPVVPDQRVIDGSDTSTTTFSATFDAASVDLWSPMRWNQMLFTLLQLMPGEAFDTNQEWFTSTDGLTMLQVQSGGLQVQPAGAATLYQAGDDQTPMQRVAGTVVTLGTGDTLVFSVRDGARLTNASNLPVIALHGLIGWNKTTEPDADIFPSGSVIQSWTILHGRILKFNDSRPRIIFERIGLAPHQAETLVLSPRQYVLGLSVNAGTLNQRVKFGVDRSAITGNSADRGDIALMATLDTSTLQVQMPTLVNVSDESIVVFLMSVEYLDSASTPDSDPGQ